MNNKITKIVAIGGKCRRHFSDLHNRVKTARLFKANSAKWLNALKGDDFYKRHIGPSDIQQQEMLNELGLMDLDNLVEKVLPKGILFSGNMDIAGPMDEKAVLQRLKKMAEKNEMRKSYIGAGYYGTVTPSVILRNIFENPGWYTQYTPYQAEISQGRLESLLNFQTMCVELTGMDFANASLLDEATACAEAMTLCHRFNRRPLFLIDCNLHPQNIAVILTRAESLGIAAKIVDWKSAIFDNDDVSGIIVQYPDTNGAIHDYSLLAKKAHKHGALFVMATDLLALTLLKPPGEIGADIALGSSQRFGVPMGYGGPHAAFFAVREDKARKRSLYRLMPGRIVGVSRDSNGRPALRLSLQTREQHIRRDKATSNICTAQALLANMSAMYALYHGPEGLRRIALNINKACTLIAAGIDKSGHKIVEENFFDTLKIQPLNSSEENKIVLRCDHEKVNLRHFRDGTIGLSIDETVGEEEIRCLLRIFDCPVDYDLLIEDVTEDLITQTKFARKSPCLQHPIFSSFHSETQLMRYMKTLENKDVSLMHSMIPLGSCTMKLNSSIQLRACSWSEFNQMHPFAPLQQTKGYQELFTQLEKWLCELTGYDRFSLQPNSGAQGEYAGLLAIKRYLASVDQHHRTVCLIPVSAHGTNPASAQLAGMKIVAVEVDKHGNVDMKDLRHKVDKHGSTLAAAMITYPSTHGVFESSIKELCALVHEKGGQVYLDGANMNAQLGLCRPADYGSDVSHLNLHKTFCIPHGGGGPGMGPVGVKAHLAPFLPSHFVLDGLKQQLEPGAVSGAPFGSASILPIPWAYIALMGAQGLRKATQVAILNANYMSRRLEPFFKTLYRSKTGFVAHEFIIDCRPFKASANVEAVDIAKRLMDYGKQSISSFLRIGGSINLKPFGRINGTQRFRFHAPTLSFPVSNCLMIEPTESEDKAELDRFIEALISVRSEIKEIENGTMPQDINLLKMAPHTKDLIMIDDWNRPYSRRQAALPLDWCSNKLWPSVGRVDDHYGDKHVFCTCPSMSAFM